MGRRRALLAEGDTGPSFIEWSDIGPPDWLARSVFLTLTPGFAYAVRVIHRPVRFWRYITPDRRIRIVSTAEARKLTEEGVLGVQCRYAVNVLDRADGQVRVLEGPERLFLEFRRCHELTGVELGGADAFDIEVEVAGVGMARSYRLSYDPERRTPLTSREKDVIRMGSLNNALDRRHR